MNKHEILTYIEASHDEVTGSSLHLTIITDDKTYHLLIDCGLFQEPNYLLLNYKSEIKSDNIDAVIITHNHVDHTGGLPKLVRNGYSKPIYMTNETQSLLDNFLTDSANQQPQNLKKIQKLYPDEKFHIPYTINDVHKTLNLVQGMDFEETEEILDGVKLTLFNNGHLLGASVVLLQISAHNAKDVNLLFTGDYKSTNAFFEVSQLPQWVLDLPLTICIESTYGDTDSSEKNYCFDDNIKEAVENDQDILVGAFAQGRMQEILYRIKKLQKAGIIPLSYKILLDGPLGIETSFIYKRLLFSSPNYKNKYEEDEFSFFPENLQIVSRNERHDILKPSGRKIVVTTSGMLSYGPAETYVPQFLDEPTLIHLTGYAAKGTLARALQESSIDPTINEIEFEGRLYHVNYATVKSTNEFSSHATRDELIDFLKQFNHLNFIIINHGETEVKKCFRQSLIDSHLAKNIEVIDRSRVFLVGSYGLKKELNSKKLDYYAKENTRKTKTKHEKICKKRAFTKRYCRFG